MPPGSVVIEIFGRHIENRPGNLAACARVLAGAQFEVFDCGWQFCIGDQYDFGFEAIGDIDIQLGRKGMRGLGIQSLNDEDVRFRAGVHAQRYDVFEQIGSVVRRNAFGGFGQRDGFRRVDAENLARQAIRTVVDLLGDRLGKTHLDAKALQGMHDG